MKNTIIQLEKVVKCYGGTLAVNNLSLEVEEGEVAVLIGPSGCGKTTTLRMINRLIEPTSGNILINGRDSRELKPELLRRSIGYAIQSVGLFPHMTVAANIAVVPHLLGWDKSRTNQRIQELLALVGLSADEYAEKYPDQLSGGESQRVGVARALAAGPPILLMDEPFGAVDPLTRERLQAQFARIQKELKKTVVLVTHDLDEAIRLADRIVIMDAGQMVQYDTPEEILSRPKNKFVRDFVGTDRALKRLSRLDVSDYMKSAQTTTSDISVSEARTLLKSQIYLWLVDEQNKLIGWIDRQSLVEAASLEDAIVRGVPAEISVSITATLREVLSRMLGQGLKCIPVIDEQGHLLGEVTLTDVETATAGIESALNE